MHCLSFFDYDRGTPIPFLRLSVASFRRLTFPNSIIERAMHFSFRIPLREGRIITERKGENERTRERENCELYLESSSFVLYRYSKHWFIGS